MISVNISPNHATWDRDKYTARTSFHSTWELREGEGGPGSPGFRTLSQAPPF